MSNCCVPYCFTNSKDYILISFHSFPTDKRRNSHWKRLVRNDGNISRNAKVCGLHFLGGRKTYDNHTPTLFPWSTNWPDIVETYNAKVTQWFRTRCNGLTTEPTDHLDHTYSRQPRVLVCSIPDSCTPTKRIVRRTETSKRALSPAVPGDFIEDTKPEPASKKRLLYPEKSDSDGFDISTGDFESQPVKPEHVQDDAMTVSYYKDTHVLCKDELQTIRIAIQTYLDTTLAENDDIKVLRKLLSTVLKLLASLGELYDTKLELYEFNRFLLRKFAGSDEEIQFWTGFYSYNALLYFFSTFIEPHSANLKYWGTDNSTGDKEIKCGPKRQLQPSDEFFLTLVKLKQGSANEDLAERFGLSDSTVSRIWLTYLKLMRQVLEKLPKWLSSRKHKKYMAESFRTLYSSVVTILDCTEFEVERASDFEVQAAMYSDYKSRCTAKALVGLSPSGIPNFISDLMEGSISDNSITMKSGLLQKLKKGDAIMADKGWTNKKALAQHGVRLVTPHFLKKKQQFEIPELVESVSIARVRIHVERCIGRIKQWNILSRRLSLTEWNALNDIWKVCVHLILFWPPIMD
ncbi:uncharacterized protein [Ptychodera flava]|uniref:uncharacterized protein n=1 Tax=Ptychodera flava TaxID=63121 RepID=UPI00396A2516